MNLSRIKTELFICWFYNVTLCVVVLLKSGCIYIHRYSNDIHTTEIEKIIKEYNNLRILRINTRFIKLYYFYDDVE